MNQRGPYDRQPDEPGWWLASDGKWYPPESAPQPPTPQQPPEPAPTVQQPQQPSGPLAPPQGTRTKWWDQTWFFVVTLLFCFPVALVLLWRKPWSRGVKIGVTALIAAVFIALAATSAASTNKQKTASPTPTTAATVAPTTRATVPPTTRAVPPTTRATVPPTTRATVPPTTAPPAPVETAGQSNARRSAEQYLSLGTGFSRTGLIDQLSSSFGSGFSLADATYGVDATHTDWNAQACLSAKNYLKVQPFSHAGLVQQLSSSFGAKFTPAEAEYGATCAGV